MKNFMPTVVTAALAVCCFTRPAHAQGPPEVQWMRGIARVGSTQTKFCSSGERFVTFGDGDTKIYRTSDGMLLRTFTQDDYVGVVDISADGKMVAILTRLMVTIRRVEDGVTTYSETFATAADCTGISLSADGNYLAYTRGFSYVSVIQLLPSVIRLADFASPGPHPVWFNPIASQLFAYPGLYNSSPFGFVRNLSMVSPLNFSPDGSLFFWYDDGLTAGHVPQVGLTNVQTGSFAELHTLPRSIHDPQQWRYALHGGTVAPDGKRMVVGTSYSGISAAYELCFVDVWNGTDFTEYLVSTPAPGPYGSAISNDGTQAIFSGYESVNNRGYIYRFSGPDFSNPANSFPVPGHGARVGAVVSSVDGSFIASASADQRVKLWSLSGGGGHLPGDQLATFDHSAPLDAVAITPDGKVIVSASGDINGNGDGSIKFWRVSDGAQIGTIPGSSNNTYGIALSPDGKYLAVARQWSSADQTGLKVYSVTRNADDSAVTTSVTAISGGDTVTVPPAFSPDGNWLAVGDSRIYQFYSNGTISVLRNSGSTPAGPVCFAPDSLTYASGRGLIGGTYPIVICDRATGAILKTIAGHTSFLRTAAISPDGKFLLSSAYPTGNGTWDHTLKIWDIASGQLRKSYDLETGGDPSGGIRSAIFSFDGNSIIYSRQDGTVVVAAMPDLIPPVTSASLSGSTVTLTATDNKSGVFSTYYTLDGGAQQTYTAPFSAGLPGSHTVVFWSTDNAGNTEAQKSSVFSVGKTVTVKATGVTGPAGTKATVSATLKGVSPVVSLAAQTLTFKLDGAVIGTKVTGSTGSASLSITLPDPVGAHTLLVEFAGDATYQPGSGTATVTVTQANTTTAVTNASGTIGQKLSLIAKLTRTTGGTAVVGKTLTFKVDGVAVGTAVTSTSGIATLANYKHESVGAFALTAEFVGDASYASSSGSGSLTVNQSATSMSIANKTVKLGKSIVLKAVLKRISDGAVLAGKSVTISLDGVTLNTVTTDATGTASVTYVAAVAGGTGIKNINATFAGDVNYLSVLGVGTLTITP